MASSSRSFKEVICSIPQAGDGVPADNLAPKGGGAKRGDYPAIPSSFNQNNLDVPSYLSKLAKVKNHEKNNSDSSKRKSMEVDDDTASSILKGSKKPKF